MNERGIKAVTAVFGGQSALGRALGLKQSTVWEWVSKDSVPYRRIPQIIAAAARLDPPAHLRPDDFFDLPTPRQPAPEPAAAEVQA